MKIFFIYNNFKEIGTVVQVQRVQEWEPKVKEIPKDFMQQTKEILHFPVKYRKTSDLSVHLRENKLYNEQESWGPMVKRSMSVVSNFLSWKTITFKNVMFFSLTLGWSCIHLYSNYIKFYHTSISRDLIYPWDTCHPPSKTWPWESPRQGQWPWIRTMAIKMQLGMTQKAEFAEISIPWDRERMLERRGEEENRKNSGKLRSAV